MDKALNNIYIIVDFDSIIKNITATGKNNNHYKKCEKYVKYDGKNVNGTNITLIKDKDYMFILQATIGNQSKPTKLLRFQDDDLTLTRVTNDDLKLSCRATKEDKNGKDVTMQVQFEDSKGNNLVASWDPTILVNTDPG